MPHPFNPSNPFVVPNPNNQHLQAQPKWCRDSPTRVTTWRTSASAHSYSATTYNLKYKRFSL